MSEILTRADRIFLVACTLAVALVGCSRPAVPRAASEIEKGVVIEEVGEGSTLEKAGLQAEDVVFRWERLPSPPANSQGAGGTIDSVFDWMWLVTEQAPRGVVKLTARRGEEVKVFEVSPGRWGATVRAAMPEGMLADYTKGKNLIEAEDLDGGIDLWHKVSGIAENLAADGRLRCWLLLQIGDAWSEARQWDKAHSAYRLALESAQDPRSQVKAWRAIGDAYETANEFEKAREAYGSAQVIRESTWGESLVLASGLSNLGMLDYLQGQLDSAQSYWQRALEIRQKLAPGSPHVAASLNSLGALPFARGDLDRAAEYFERGLEIQQELAPGSIDVAPILNNLGILAHDRGDLDRAIEYFEASLEIRHNLAPGSLDVAASLNNLGTVARDRGDLDRAIEYFEASLEIRQKLAPGSLDVAASLNNLGAVADDRGDLDRAAEYYEGSLEIRQNLAPGSHDMALSLLSLGVLASDRGDLDRAADYNERALEIQQKLLLQLAPGTALEAKVLYDMATVRREQNQPQLALALFHQGLQALENQVDRFGGSRDVQANFRARRADYYRDTINLSLELHKAEEAFHILERSRAQSFLAQLAERDLVFTDVPQELARQRRRIAHRYDQTLAGIAQLHSGEQAQKIETRRHQLQRLRREHDDVTEKIRNASPWLGALRYPQPLDFAAARKALDPGTVMLSYSVGEESTKIFVLASAGDLRVERIAITEKDLRIQIRKWSEVIPTAKRGDATGNLHSVRVFGKRLYKQLIEPVADAVAEGKRLLIIPDGPLHVLPWGALIRETETADEMYLAEWKPLHTVLSATVHAQIKQRRPARLKPGEEPSPVRLAAFGDPHYPGGGESFEDFRVRSAVSRGLFDVWRSLPYTRREIEQIAALYPAEATRIYLGAEATEEAVKALGRNPHSASSGGGRGEIDILHLAAHGHLDDRSPLDSAVVLTIPQDPGTDRDNGLLQVWEIFERVRFNADLVVLSACASGVGEEQVGEGLIGLTRAFQYAGARSVVASLWNVQDQATAELMVRFYRHLKRGMTYDEALRAAQSELIRGEIEVKDEDGRIKLRDYSAPYYWAPFQIYGDWK